MAEKKCWSIVCVCKWPKKIWGHGLRLQAAENTLQSMFYKRKRGENNIRYGIYIMQARSCQNKIPSNYKQVVSVRKHYFFRIIELSRYKEPDINLW